MHNTGLIRGSTSYHHARDIYQADLDSYLEEHLDYYRSVINPAVQLTVNTLLRPLLCHSPPHEPLDPGSGNDSGEPFFPSIILRNQETGKMIGNFEVVKPTADAPLADEGGEEHTPVSAQTWEIAYNLLPEWRGKGIAGHAMDVIVEGWVKWIGIGYLMAVSSCASSVFLAGHAMKLTADNVQAIETENPCSAALVKSRGFEISKTFTQPWPEDKGGGEREQSQWVVKVDKYKSRLA